MISFNWQDWISSFDERRDIIIPGNTEETIEFCVKQFIQIGQEAIENQSFFAVALSGGSTPNAIFKKLGESPYNKQLDWTQVLCFWSDERSVPPNHPENNYHMAMEAGLSTLPIPPENIFRMPAEFDIEENARLYEQKILEYIPSGSFDLMMLGVGEDGHTASLFPLTHGLHTAKEQLVTANYVPQKQTWRMSVTYECIERAKVICIYALGKNKAAIVTKVLAGSYDPDHLPSQRIGTPTHKAIWILDQDASQKLVKEYES